MKKKIIILGSTGSIGKNLINILKKDKSNFEICLISADKNIKELLKQAELFKIKNIVVTNFEKYLIIKKLLKKKKINIYNNFNTLEKIFNKKKVDYVMSSISGLDGLRPTLKIIKFTKKIAIANKESIICGWSLIKKELLKYGTKFIPVDSEHYSIYSLIGGVQNKNIEKIFITASGGPFNKYPLSKFKTIKLEAALKHPNWKMGKKITIDSATMMNKVFEVIEAKKIFNVSYEQIKILVHPKSYVHALIKFNNGVTKILIHDTNMKIPIFNSLYENELKTIKTKNLDFTKINNLNFKIVDTKKFPVIKILKKISNNDSLFETIIVAANDKLVNLFLDDQIKFLDISKNLIKVINKKEFLRYRDITPKSVEQIVNLSNYVSLKINTMAL